MSQSLSSESDEEESWSEMDSSEIFNRAIARDCVGDPTTLRPLSFQEAYDRLEAINQPCPHKKVKLSPAASGEPRFGTLIPDLLVMVFQYFQLFDLADVLCLVNKHWYGVAISDQRWSICAHALRKSPMSTAWLRRWLKLDDRIFVCQVTLHRLIHFEHDLTYGWPVARVSHHQLSSHIANPLVEYHEESGGYLVMNDVQTRQVLHLAQIFMRPDMMYMSMCMSLKGREGEVDNSSDLIELIDSYRDVEVSRETFQEGDSNIIAHSTRLFNTMGSYLQNYMIHLLRIIHQENLPL